MSQLQIAVPEFETERLRLRPHTTLDFPNLKAMWADPEVTRYIGGKPYTTEESWARLLRYAGHWALLGFGYWLVEEKSSGEFAGGVGFSDYKRELDPPLAGVPEAGWVLCAAKQGKGYATEAVLGALGWGLKQWGPVSVACIIQPEHERSIRVAEKCGFTQRELGRYKNAPTLIFERTLGE